MKQRSFLDTLVNSRWQIWLLFFLYPLLVGFFVQLVALPHLFPSLHAGEGLLKGGDWLYFHQLAKDLAERIRAEGWQAWELRPEGQAPAGIAALVYLLFGPHPWAMLPLNACIHACSGLILFSIVRKLVGDAWVAFLATCPFVFFPSAMNWYAQIHKDGIFALGALLFLWGWGRIVQEDAGRVRDLLHALLAIVGGALIVFVVRPYAVEILWFLSVLLSLILSGAFLFLKRCRKGSWLYPLFLWLAVLGILGVVKLEKPIEKPSTYPWSYSPWVPDFVEEKLRGLAEVRNLYRFIDPEAMGNIDWDVTFHSVSDILRYVPRALAIGFFAPFPKHWFQEGTSPGGALKRRICGLEMVIAYFSFPGFLLFLWRFRRATASWVLLFHCTLMVLIYTLAFPNLGPLYRERYGFFMVIVALGITGWSGVLSREGFFRQNPVKLSPNRIEYVRSFAENIDERWKT